MSHVILRSNELEVVVGDNEPGTGPVSSHCGGYNGIWSLKSRHAPANCFAPSYAGLNFEHCYDERFQSAVDHKELIYEPRNTPMRLVEATDSSAVLHQPPTAWTGVESWTRFQVEDNRIEFEFRAIPRKEPAGGWLGMFWASYLHAPADSGISFLGDWPEDSSPTGWMKLAADAHGVHAGVTGSDPVSHPDHREQGASAAQPFARLVYSQSHRRYAEPMFYGRPANGRMMLLYLFDPAPGLRILQSPVGGGWSEEEKTWNPAWDFQLISRPACEGQEIALRGRVVYKPFESRDEILQLLEQWRGRPGK